jgi:hypothetical protein
MEIDFSDQFIDNRRKGGIFGGMIMGNHNFLYSLKIEFRDTSKVTNNNQWNQKMRETEPIDPGFYFEKRERDA